ncbi:DUF6339 family protein [Rubripirellula reticaptiva]|uniref:Uncharacterized protein n=1 Tax=Rubripirellula reticaptiva TaxID=2528013 RepID=A0A5C6F9Y8_9BACT|nr:DUF6339 family protein [Rubripirellula reticaptiva]TWU57672.1 hypothetical protein Poly59_05790 [Rubripirellula reticaptiva]
MTNQNKLRNLRLSVRTLLDESFRSLNGSNLDTTEFEDDFHRDIDLESLAAIVAEAESRFGAQVEKADTWLAPRVHASLRLTRREASRRELWAYLNVAAFPDFVRWRHTSTQGPSKGLIDIGRFIGENSRNALGRLWWAAEMTRNGSDYSLTEKAMSTTRFSISWQSLDTLHHKAFALACVKFLTEGNGGSPLNDVAGKRLAKAVNLCLRTTHIDAIAPSQLLDEIAIQDWVNSVPDYTRFLDSLPTGPDEDSVNPDDIETFINFLSDVATQIDIFDSVHDDSTEGEEASEIDAMTT